MEKKNCSWLRRLINASLHSARGLAFAWRCEASFRLELPIILILLPVAFWLGVTAAQRALLIFAILLILLTELVNSAIEAAIDRIGPEHHPLSGQAKDLGSAAVLVALVMAAVVWAIIAWERFEGLWVH